MHPLADFFNAGPFMPHGHCYFWTGSLVALHAVSDTLTALAYYSIPITLVAFVRRRRDLDFHWMFLCFAVFILACGTTHLLEVWNIWHANYWLSGGFKAVTALASVPTAVLLVRLLPQALALPSPTQLRVANESLRAEAVERAQASDLLRRSEERFRLLVENVRDYAIFWLDPEGHVASWNAGAERIKGYSAAEIIGRHFSVFYPAVDVEGGKPQMELKAAIADGRHEDEGWRVRKDGTRFWANVVLSAIYDGSGELCGFAKVTRDITERRRFADRLRRRTEELALSEARRESDARLQAVIEHLSEGLVISDLEGNMLHWNHAASAMHGFSHPHEFRERLADYRNRYELLTLDGSPLPFEQWPMPRIYRGETLHNLELRLRHLGAKWERTFAYNGGVVCDASGSSLAFLSIFDITERKRSEEALRASEELLRRVIDLVPHAIFAKTSDNRYLFANRACAEFNGFTPEQMVGHRASEVIADRDEREGFAHDDREMIENGRGKFVTEEFQTDHAGHRRTLETTKIPFRAPKTGEPALLGISVDITERKRDEQEARLLQSLALEISAAGTLEATLKAVLNEALRITGWRVGEAWVPEEDGVHLKPMLHVGLDGQSGDAFALATSQTKLAAGEGLPGRAWATKQPCWMEDVTREPDFARKEAAHAAGIRAGVATPVLVGERVVAVLAFFDLEARRPDPLSLRLLSAITTRLGTIIERRQAEDAIEESNERFQIVARATNDAVWDWDARTDEIWWNPVMEERFGYRLENQRTSAGWRVERIHPADRERVTQTLAACLRGEASNLWTAEYRFRTADGTYLDVFDRGYVVRNAAGQALRMIGAMMDITARKRAEAKIHQLNDELEQRVVLRTAELQAANRELESFSYSVSHDLRAPLRAIDGYSLILLEDHAAQLGQEGRHLLDVVRGEAQRMGKLVDELLAFSRLGRQALNHSAVDMTDLARIAFDEVAPPAMDSPRDITWTLDDLPPAVGDATLLRQVWANLLSNALKFTQGKANAIIAVSGRQAQGENIYRVQDNGAGFNMQYANKLFGVFQRLHSEEEFEGTGVGLAITQRIVERHGGRIWAEGTLAAGATFYFALPRTERTEPC